jgi:hypothetical protein
MWCAGYECAEQNSELTRLTGCGREEGEERYEEECPRCCRQSIDAVDSDIHVDSDITAMALATRQTLSSIPRQEDPPPFPF